MKKVLSVAFVATVAAHSFAAVTLLTSRGQITESDYIDWADKGPAFTGVGNPSTIMTHGTPFAVKVSSTTAGLQRRDQGFSGGWNGDFNPNEALLYVMSGDALYLTGAKTCSDAGANIQGDHYGAYNAYIAAWDGLDNLLGIFSVSGVSTANADGSAPFIGVHSDAGDIHRVGFAVLHMDSDGRSDFYDSFAINRVSYSCCQAVPEPASMSALAVGALALLRKKAKKA